MKLLRFRIGSYRVLRNLDIDFERSRDGDALEESCSLDFLAGVNGTGKSTVLHLLGRVFSWLEKNDWFPVPIELKYRLGEHTITVSNLPEDDAPFDTRLRYWIDEEEPRTGQVLDTDYLPRYIVMYTTGDEQEWQSLLEIEEDELQTTTPLSQSDTEELAKWYLNELPGRGYSPIHAQTEEETLDLDKRMLFIQRDRLPAVALCGLLASRSQERSDGKAILHDALESVGVESLVGFSLRCRVHGGLILPEQNDVVARIGGCADRIIQQGADLLLVFDLDRQDQAKDTENSIFGLYEGHPLSLFQAVNSLYEHRPYQDSPLQEVNLFFKRKSTDDEEEESILHLWDWLSDGERSFLARMALFALFREHDILILMDEPEVHFNDVWKREIVNMLSQIMKGCRSHALITTHSSIALTDVNRKDIVVLTRDGAHVERSGSPRIETFGADPSDIMVHVFGTPYPSGEHSVRSIRERMGSASSSEELERLKDTVAPGYWRYRVQLEIEHFPRRH